MGHAIENMANGICNSGSGVNCAAGIHWSGLKSKVDDRVLLRYLGVRLDVEKYNDTMLR